MKRHWTKCHFGTFRQNVVRRIIVRQNVVRQTDMEPKKQELAFALWLSEA
jgi:hypothetical protein